MGYRRPPLVLEFDAEEFAGLEVRCRRLSIGDTLRLTRLRAGVTEASVDDRLGEMLGLVAKLIESWNLEDDDGVPVPTTAEAIGEQDFGLITAIMVAATAAAGVSRPLPQPSADGGPSLEESIPMEPLLPNPPN